MRATSIITACWGLTLLLSGPAMAQAIFTCVDSKGRKLTSDRQIAECTDRAQHEITPSGTVRRVLPPTLTALERTVQDEKERQMAEVRAVEADEKRRDRALIMRYPTRKVHDTEREWALAQLDDLIQTASKHSHELAEQRKPINSELEFHQKDLSKAPYSLKRRLEENDNSLAVQKRFIADQEVEKKRVNTRFDDELVKLNQLWSLMGFAGAPAPAAGATKRR